MSVPTFAVKLDQHLSADRNVGDAQLSAEQVDDRLGVCGRDFIMLDQPVGDLAVIGPASNLRVEFGRTGTPDHCVDFEFFLWTDCFAFCQSDDGWRSGSRFGSLHRTT